jgi:hypothetical protein
MGGYVGKGERPCGGGMRHVHCRIEDELWGKDGGFRLEKRKIYLRLPLKLV